MLDVVTLFAIFAPQHKLLGKMNRFSFFAALGCAALLAAGCGKTGSDVPAPAADVTVTEVTASSISFSVSAVNATQGAYMVVPGDETVPEASAILSEGTSVDLSSEAAVTVDGLAPSTAYTVAVAVSSADGRTAVATAEVTTEAVPAIVLDRASGKHYGAGINWGITVRGNVDGIEYEVSLDLYDVESVEAGYLTEGVYTVSEGMADGDLNSDYSYVQKDNDQYKFVSGTLDVAVSADGYSLRLDTVLNDGSNFSAVYEGPVDGIEIAG